MLTGESQCHERGDPRVPGQLWNHTEGLFIQHTRLPVPVFRAGDTEMTEGGLWCEGNQKPSVNSGWAGFRSLNAPTWSWREKYYKEGPGPWSPDQ